MEARGQLPSLPPPPLKSGPASKRACEVALLPDMELGHWVTRSMGHLGHLSLPGHRVIILTRCVTQASFSFFFEKNDQNAKHTFEILK